MKRSMISFGRPAVAASVVALMIAATTPSMGQKYNYDMPGYIPNKGTATGGPAGGPDQRQFVPAGSTGGRSGGPDQRQVKKVKIRKAKPSR